MEKYYQSYNLAYEKFTPEWFCKENESEVKKFLKENSESMIIFLNSYFSQFNINSSHLVDKNILITGCGFGGLCHYLAKMQTNVTGIDISTLAIMGAKEIAKNLDLKIDFIAQDLCGVKADKKYDFVIDDHLLHCLTTDEDRKNYLDFIKGSLKSDGLFLLESMAFHNKIQTPIGFLFDENNILWQEIDGVETMIRKISPSIEIENEVINSGLMINYLYYHSELAFHVFPGMDDYPFEYLPRTIRLSAKLANA